MTQFDPQAQVFQKPVKEEKKQHPEIELNHVVKSVGQYNKMLKQQEKPQNYNSNWQNDYDYDYDGNQVVRPSEANYNHDVTIIGLKEDKSLANFHKAKVGMTEPLKTSKRYHARKRRSLHKQQKEQASIDQDLDQMNKGVNTFCSGGEGEVGCVLI